MSTTRSKVYVVFCIDTEGPYTDPNYFQPSQLIGTWKGIDQQFLTPVFSKQFRYSHPDSDGNPAVFTWFMLNWVGFRTNPIIHDLGYHKVYDHYVKNWGKQLKKYGDEIAWHYHHPSLSGIGNEWGVNWFDNKEYENLLCRMLIDRQFYPKSYRAGGTIEDNDQSNWLEQWVPFDFSSRSDKNVNWEKIEADGSKLGDILPWRNAPNQWVPYHPSKTDITKPGSMKRYITKSLDIKSNAHNTTYAQILAAFKQVAKGQSQILSLFEHDFRDRSAEMIQIMQWIDQASKATKVSFNYVSAAQAVQQLQKLSTKNKLKLSISKLKDKLVIKSNQPLFNNQPYLAIKYSKNVYNWLPMFKTSDQSWEYYPLFEDKGKTIAVAAHDINGNTFIKVFVL